MNAQTRFIAGTTATFKAVMQPLSNTTAAHLVRVRRPEPVLHGRNQWTATQSL